MNFVIGLPISINWKEESYDSILVIVDWLTKIIHYELVKIIIDASRPPDILLDMVVQYHGLSNSIVTDRGSIFTSKVLLLLCYFLGIKQKLSTAFHPQTDGQIERKNSTIEAYLQAFVTFEQNE